ncbi:MAG TPA: PBP1A family penicillin-binding protein [Candidatus Limnocylindrales bacterium]|nr:PBP1A family penicillin-binding protein [Candidatus Limnocylindrales bacterium]
MSHRWKWIAKVSSALLIVVVCGTVGVGIGVANWARQDLPSPASLQTIAPPVKTLVYDVNGKLVHEFYKENRSLVPLRQIPRGMVDAILSIEDRRFYQHWGIDPVRLIGALIQDVIARRPEQGASTITQQLARNLFLTHEKTFSRKIKEAILAVRIEQTYTKDEILQMYLNQIYFGEGAYGVDAAARIYFGKPVIELTLPECALLAGLPRNPRDYSPRRDPDRALKRRNLVLASMLQNKKINRAQYETASEAPLGVSKTRVDPREAPYFMEMVRLYLEERYGSNQIFEGGLRIYTTLDADLQQAAEESLERRLTDLEQRNGTKKTRASVLAKSKTAQPGEKSQTDYLQGAVVCIDPASGQIRALVGGRDFNESNFNRATQAARQPGSAFKPFIYTAAIDNGYTPNEMILDTPVSFRAGNGEDWSPQNYDHKFRGPVTLRTALAKSLNVPAAKLLQKLGTPVVTSYARRLGIHSHLGNDLSLALGTSEVNLLELTSAYGVFADQGVRTTPVFVLRVEDKNGKILEQTRTAAEEVLSPETALTMTNMMQTVLQSGTAAAARSIGLTVPAAGKTGTTDDYTDAWFVGYTPNLVTGVWVGFDRKQKIGPNMTGAAAALPIWVDVVSAGTKGKPPQDFPVPNGVVSRLICSQTGLLANPSCPETETELFREGSEPTGFCDIHTGAVPPPEVEPHDLEQHDSEAVPEEHLRL